MKQLFLNLLLSFIMVGIFGQDRTITGTVKDNEGIPLIGASILVKSANIDRTIGTITNIDGEFTLSIPTGADSLLFSYIGYQDKTFQITNQSVFDVTLAESTTMLDDVVVTALGIKKEKKALGYSFEEVSGDELTTNRDANFINTLSNKVAGVNISQTAGGAGTSSRIIIRGVKSLGNESQPLIVVDGIPMDNSSDGASWLGGVDYGSSLGGISPDDIETMSVLKGPNAAALYGSRAANGVIMITTKSGSKKEKLQVTVNSNFMFDRAYIVADYQNEYGAGFGGTMQKQPLTPEQQLQHGRDSAYYYYSTGSWGPRMVDTLEILNWNNEFTTLSPQPDNVRNYFRDGYTFTNSVALTNGNESYNWRFSVSSLENKGLKPNSEYDRQTVNFNINATMNKFLDFSFKGNYIHEDAFNRVGQGDSRTGARTFIWMPRSISTQALRDDFKSPNGLEQNWYFDDWHTNPYWEAFENYNNDNKDQFVGYAQVNATFTPWLSGHIRTSMDTYTSKRYLRIANGALRANGEGAFTEQWINLKSLNHDFLLTAQGTIGGDWDISGNVGGNYYNVMVDRQSTSIAGLAVPNFFSINNKLHPDQTSAGAFRTEKVIQSLYGSAQVNYDSWWYLELTSRWDWSSSLPVFNLPYFYPSVNTSIVFHDLLGINNRILSFGKFRFSYAFVGKDTNPHQLSRRYMNQNFGGVPAVYLDPVGFNSNLKPENTGSWEVGTDLRFFQNRIGVDFTYYDETSYNQIIDAEISSASGYTKVLTNGGEIQNKGVELLLNLKPVQTPSFDWEMSFNYARNRNTVLSLAEGLSQYTVTGESQIDIIAVPGRPYGEIIGTTYERYYRTDGEGNVLDDPNNGRPLIDENGLYIQGSRGVIGNITPDFTGGITNNLRYKNLSLSFTIGFQVGGDIFSKTNKYGLDNGQFVQTLEGRDSWYNATQDEKDMGRMGLYNPDGSPMLDVDEEQMFDPDGSPAVGYVPSGVLADGTENTLGIDPQVYWHQHKWGGIAELDVYDASYVKLRDVTLNFDLPNRWFENNFISNASLALVGRNLWLIYSGVPNIDPELSFASTNNALGQEYAAMPAARSVGVNIRIVF